MFAVRDQFSRCRINGICAPTQITVGMREVKAKQSAGAEPRDEKAPNFSARNDPGILGPKKRHHVIDHYHLVARASRRRRQESDGYRVSQTSARSKTTHLWFVLDTENRCTPFHDEGRRRDHKGIPKSIKDLIDDPFRRRRRAQASGRARQDTTPSSEFLWADFLRRCISASCRHLILSACWRQR